MTLYSTTPMLNKAKKEGYGIVAFNVHSFDSIFWVVEGAAGLYSLLFCRQRWERSNP